MAASVSPAKALEINKTNEENLVATRVCKACNREFKQFENLAPAKLCPTCKDISQRRDSVVVGRRCQRAFHSLKIDIIPGIWEQVKHRKEDFPSYKTEVAGRDLPGSTPQATGRIIVRSRFPYKPGAVVSARAMEATYISRRTGRISVRRYIALDDRTAEEENTPVLYYWSIGSQGITIVDKSLWSAKAFSDKPQNICETIVMIAAIDHDHTVSLEGDEITMTFP